MAAKIIMKKLILIIGLTVFACSAIADGVDTDASSQATATKLVVITKNSSVVNQMKELITNGEIDQAISLGETNYQKKKQSEVALYLGKAYFLNKNYDQAYTWFKLAADGGQNLAMLTLGNMYGSGTGVKLDVKQAIHWYEKAIALGNIDAMNYLGLIYRDGLDKDKTDYIKAFNLFKLASSRGSDKAYFNLGDMYQNGLGVMVSYNKAIDYYIKAAKMGNVYAMNNLGVIYAKGLGVTQDYHESFNWYMQAANQNDANAQCNLGIFYYDGIGVTKNYTEAKKWLILAKQNGCKVADQYLAKLTQAV